MKPINWNSGRNKGRSEKQEQEALIRWTQSHKNKYFELDLLFAIPNAGGYTGTYKQNMLRVMGMKRQGVKPGVPDLFLPVPSRKTDHPNGLSLGLFIEMKANKNELSDAQAHWKAKLLLIGYKVEVCYSLEQAAKAIQEYLGLPKEILP